MGGRGLSLYMSPPSSSDLPLPDSRRAEALTDLGRKLAAMPVHPSCSDPLEDLSLRHVSMTCQSAGTPTVSMFPSSLNAQQKS